jgi:Ca2+-transporting ATPase
MDHHSETGTRVLAELASSERGLSQAEAARRLASYGRNELPRPPARTWLMLLRQFNSPVIWLLFGAFAISLAFGDALEAFVILAILVLNAVLGFFQEHKAQRAIAALRRMMTLKATALRDGRELSVDAAELVPGDIVVLEVGMRVPADVRLLKQTRLATQEASLTGESLPVQKETALIPASTGIAERMNMCFAGTVIVAGRGLGVIVATGMKTEIGRIAHLLEQTPEQQTPLQKKLDTLGRWVTIAVIAIAVIIFAAGLLEGEEPVGLFLVAVAVAVAAVPEGLPAVVTLTLALGVQRMARRNALVRRLSSVQTLGACTVIFADKTGTLTRNEMTVRELYIIDERIGVSGSGYERTGAIAAHLAECRTLLLAGAQCNNASITYEDGVQTLGDPTEVALLVSAQKGGISRQTLAAEPRVAEIPFSSERKRMTTIHRSNASRVAYTKGYVDNVLPLCTHKESHGRVTRLTDKDRRRITLAAEHMAKQSLRVLAFATRRLRPAEKSDAAIERNLVFVGLQGMIDPPRPEAKQAVLTARQAGIRVVMITGDHPLTAQAIAAEIGIPGRVMTDEELDAADDVYKAARDVGVFAHVNPMHKLRIVDAFKRHGQVVAMTGDGVNDAPALKAAAIGVAMGRIGTDVAREASDIVLADDNFATIVEAVRGGRAILDNITKFVAYMLSANSAEVLIVFLGIMLFFSYPLTLIMLLWINLVTDGLPALALTMEKPEPLLMKRRPRPADQPLLTQSRVLRMLFNAVVMTALSLVLFHWCLPEGVAHAQTLVFSALVLMELAIALSERSERQTILGLGLFSNMWLLGSIVFTVLLQVLVVNWAALQPFFGTTALDLRHWLVAFVAAIVVFVLAQVVMSLTATKE